MKCKKWSKLLKVFCFGLFMVAPIGATIWLSIEEQKKYIIANQFELEEVAYGDILLSERVNLQEQIIVSGKVVSNHFDFIELGKYNDTKKLRLIVSNGDYVYPGKLIGYYGSTELYADKKGIVASVEIGEQAYIRIESVENLVLEIACKTNADFNAIMSSSEELKDQQGNHYAVQEALNYVNEEGQRLIRLSIQSTESSYMYGEKVNDLVLSTGKEYTGVLVIDKRCVYSYDNGNTYYVRTQINENSFEEKEVTVGKTIGDYICIDGIDEGTRCDSGYKMMVGKNDEAI